MYKATILLCQHFNYSENLIQKDFNRLKAIKKFLVLKKKSYSSEQLVESKTSEVNSKNSTTVPTLLIFLTLQRLFL